MKRCAICWNRGWLFLFLGLLLSCEEDKVQERHLSDAPDESSVVEISGIRLETLASGFSIPWGIAVIDQETFLFTDRRGTLHHYREGEVSLVRNVPGSSTFTTPGGLVMAGLMDVSLHPDFGENGLVYVAHVTFDNRLSVTRFRLNENTAEQVVTIFKANEISVGSRISWQDEDHFFISVGVGGDPLPILGPQDLEDDKGKIHRLKADGTIPADNPVFEGHDAPTSIWSYGHRNPQGMFFDEEKQILYANEHGPFGGDELNVIEKGGNYGWPRFSYGLNYNGSSVSFLTEDEAAEFSILPMKYWDHHARVSPSGLLKLTNSNFSQWNGSFLMGSLYPQNLLRYDPQTDQTEVLLGQIGRVRDVVQLPDGDLLILIDAHSPNPTDTGRILKLSPVN